MRPGPVREREGAAKWLEVRDEHRGREKNREKIVPTKKYTYNSKF